MRKPISVFSLLLGLCDKRQQCQVPGALDSDAQAALLTFGQTGFFAALDATVLVHIALQGFEIFVVKKRYVSLVFKNLCHSLLLFVLVFVAGMLSTFGCLLGFERTCRFCLSHNFVVKAHNQKPHNFVSNV
jgi:hypothetical protein